MSVVPKRELKKKLKICKIFNDLKEELKDFSVAELLELRLNPELLKHICNIVENTIKKKYKPNKKDIVLSIVTKLIPSISELDKKLISDAIEFLHGNGDIKKSSVVKMVGVFFLKSLKQKLLA
jgi:hypothetical protein